MKVSADCGRMLGCRDAEVGTLVLQRSSADEGWGRQSSWGAGGRASPTGSCCLLAARGSPELMSTTVDLMARRAESHGGCVRVECWRLGMGRSASRRRSVGQSCTLVPAALPSAGTTAPASSYVPRGGMFLVASRTAAPSNSSPDPQRLNGTPWSFRRVRMRDALRSS